MDTVKSRSGQRRSRETRMKDPGLSAPSRHSSQSGGTQGERDSSLLSVTDIAALGKVDEAAVERCIREDPRFPEPVAHRSTGELYDRSSVYKWAIEAGLEALEPGLHTVRSH